MLGLLLPQEWLNDTASASSSTLQLIAAIIFLQVGSEGGRPPLADGQSSVSQTALLLLTRPLHAPFFHYPTNQEGLVKDALRTIRHGVTLEQ